MFRKTTKEWETKRDTNVPGRRSELVNEIKYT
jgi:hypothetical protein